MVFLVDQASPHPGRNFQSLAVDHHPHGNLFYFSECQKVESQNRGEGPQMSSAKLYGWLCVYCCVGLTTVVYTCMGSSSYTVYNRIAITRVIVANSIKGLGFTLHP